MFLQTLKNSRGFTLIELMMSLIILAIAFLGILPMFFYSQAQIKEATLTNLALNIIEDKMNRIMSLDYDHIDYRDFQGDPLHPSYTYILPEVTMAPCTSYPGVCGFIASQNMLRDVVEKDGYFFTRYIDIDDPALLSSWRSEPDSAFPLTIDGQTKRITITVEWTVPGNKTRSVTAITEIFNAPRAQGSF